MNTAIRTSGWDVFDSRDGVPIRTVRLRRTARRLCKLDPHWDYERTGKGWS